LLLADLVWFKLALEAVYTPMFQKINQGPMNFRMIGGIAWLFLAIGLEAFVLSHAQQHNWSMQKTALQAALFGFITYGVYNATNYATINSWTPAVWLSDNLWGSFVCTLSALTVYYLLNLPTKPREIN
jgi:uncharacterized membrane protein